MLKKAVLLKRMMIRSSDRGELLQRGHGRRVGARPLIMRSWESDVGDGGYIILVDQIKQLFKTCTEDDFFQ